MSVEPQTIAQTVEAATAAGPIEAFGLNVKIFFAQLVNFLLVLVVLWRFVYRPVVAMLEAREEKIKKSVEHAEEIERKLKETERAREEALAQTRLEATRLIEEAQAKAEEKQQEVLAKTRKEAEKIVYASRAHIAEEREKMFADVRGEVAGLVVAAAEKILASSVDKKRSEAMTEEVMKEAGL
ncbi:F0F1 ATP synthase subunit B [Candidatus Uhrbacteria bacterium]|nr:F0F1 ATP synthase subunit B [Candidatus Uhrbacteria bacterium]